MLAEARRRTTRADAPVELRRGDALDSAAWAWLDGRAVPLLLISGTGLAPWLDRGELRQLLARFAAHLAPGGYLLIDRWNWGRHARWGRDAEIHATYHTDAEYRTLFAGSGLVPLECEALGAGEGALYLVTTAAREPGGRSAPA